MYAYLKIMDITKQIGKMGENLTCQYLQSKGYKIIDRNFHYRYGEIDIIAKRNNELIFVEVKTRTNCNFGKPAEAVNNIKKKHIYKTAKYYIYSTGKQESQIRFDVVEVFIQDGKIKFNHIEQIF